jgi:hypothetical protein
MVHNQNPQGAKPLICKSKGGTNRSSPRLHQFSACFVWFSSSGWSTPSFQKSRSVTTLAQRGRTWRLFGDVTPLGGFKFDARDNSCHELSATGQTLNCGRAKRRLNLTVVDCPWTYRTLRSHTLSDLLKRYAARHGTRSSCKTSRKDKGRGVSDRSVYVSLRIRPGRSRRWQGAD